MNIRIDHLLFQLFLLSLVLTSCGGRSHDRSQLESDTIVYIDSIVTQISSDTLSEELVTTEAFDIYGDTVWINPYGSQKWFDTIIGDNYFAILEVEVDTNDYIIDTVRSVKGNRIVIGYNHKYKIVFTR